MAGIASFNLVVAACLTLLFVFINPSWTWRDVSHQAVGSFVYTNTIGIPSAIIFSRMGAWILGRRVAVRWTLMIGVFLAIAAAGTLAASVILYAIYSPTWSDFWVQYLQGFRIAALITLIVGIGSVYYEMQKRRLEATTLELRTRELERERMLKQATEARLAALESRIHPHFLFNALNSISSLIPDDPQRAERLIERMAALLRFSLDSGRRGLAPLAQEMKIVADYLEIEKNAVRAALALFDRSAGGRRDMPGAAAGHSDAGGEQRKIRGSAEARRGQHSGFGEGVGLAPDGARLGRRAGLQRGRHPGRPRSG